MITQNCPYCRGSLPDRPGAFCPCCGEQAKCSSCQALLEPSAFACVECGSRVGEHNAVAANGFSQQSSAPNVIRLEESRTNRSFEAHFTDAGLESLSGPLSAYLRGGLFEARQSRRRSEQVGAADETGAAQLPLLSAHAEDIIDIVTPSPEPTEQTEPNDGEPASEDQALLHRIFSYSGGHLRLKDARIKADLKKEYVARLTCTFVYAHELDGRPSVPRTAVKAILTETKLFDANARGWLANTNDLMRDGESVRLSNIGRERAAETLRRNEDPNVTGIFELGAVTKKRTKKVATSPDGEGARDAKIGQRSRTLSSAKIVPWVERWKSLGVAVDAFRLLNGKTPAEKGLFGLWAIRKALDDAGKVVTRVQLAQFLYQAFEIKVDDSTLGKALSHKDLEDRVVKVGGTRFQINPAGMAFVEERAGLREAGKTTASVASNGATPTGTRQQ